jgi:S1-C subfamily serine protease
MALARTYRPPLAVLVFSLALVTASCDRDRDRAALLAEMHQLRLEVEYLQARVDELSPRGAPGVSAALNWAGTCETDPMVNCGGVSARFLPAYADGRPWGVKATRVQAGGIWAACGLAAGDTILRAGDVPIRTPAGLPQALEQCALGKVLTVSRAGREIEARPHE